MLEDGQLRAACTDPNSNYYSEAFTPRSALTIPLDVRADREANHFSLYAHIYIGEYRDNKGLLNEGFLGQGEFRDIYMSSTGEYPYELLLQTGQTPNMADVININSAEIERNLATVIDNLFPTQQVNSEKLLSIQLSAYDIHTIKNDQQRLGTLAFHFAMMMKFYGFQLDLQDVNKPIHQHTVTVGFDERPLLWMQENSPHYQHITTMITSLRLLGLDNFAQAFVNRLERVAAADSNAPIDHWKTIANSDLPAQPAVPAAEAIPEANINAAWETVVTSLQTYYTTHLQKDEGIDRLAVRERNAKRNAILNILKTLTDKPAMQLTGIPHINIQNADLSSAQKKQALETAGAIARGYIVGFPDTTASWLRQSRLHIHLEDIVEKQQQCVTGELPAPSMSATPK